MDELKAQLKSDFKQMFMRKLAAVEIAKELIASQKK